MAADLRLPLLGDVMREGTVAAWLRPDGARVEQGDPLYQLETDKVSYTVEAPAAGLLERLIAEGETVPVGTVVGRIREPEETSPSGPTARPAAEETAVRASPAARRLADQLGVDIAAMGAQRRIREADVRAFHASTRAAPAATAEHVALRATPAARRRARELGVDLAVLDRGALIREDDVRRAPTTPTTAPARIAAEPTVRELGGRRRLIAERMHASLQQMAQLTVTLEADFTPAQQLREQLRQLWPAESRPTITDLVARACVLALRAHPALNATLEGTRLTLHAPIHLGLAVDVDEGLIVPVLRDAGSLSLRQLAEQTRSLARQARDGRLGLDDLQGATFTITSLGQLGIDVFTPIVNAPQVAIVGIGRVSDRLVLVDGRVEQRLAMHLSLSFDHRALDGAPAARFLGEVKRLLELPAALIA